MIIKSDRIWFKMGRLRVTVWDWWSYRTRLTKWGYRDYREFWCLFIGPAIVSWVRV